MYHLTNRLLQFLLHCIGTGNNEAKSQGQRKCFKFSLKPELNILVQADE